MVAFDPYDFHAALGVAELSDTADELPVLAREPGEIQVLENVPQQNEPLEGGILEQMEEVGRQRDRGAEVDVRDY